MIMPEEIYAPEVIAPIGEEYIPPPPEKVKGEYLPPVEHGEYPPAISGYYKRNDIYYPEAPYVDEYVEEAIAPMPIAPPVEKIAPLPVVPPMEKVAPLPVEPIPPIAAPYPVDSYIAPIGGGNKCSSGPVQCCESVEAGGSDKVAGVAGLLGLVLGPILGDLQVGLTCNSLLGGGSCSSQTVCCENVHTSGLIAMGCSPITIDIL
ncbi:hypothetical protein ONZ45_g19458 [Pleurotus djamor]|nr:hypothetical protein ONZ45_g19458 [Pleurotus djamor]